MRIVALSGAVVLAAAAAATLAWGSSPARSLPGPAQIVEFEATAQQGCRCARAEADRGGDIAGCWAELDRKIAGYEPSESSALCGRFSPTEICFGESSDELCFTKDYGGGACTAEEAKILQAIYAAAIRGRDETSPHPDEAADQAVKALIRGDTLTPARGVSEVGCN